MKRIAIVIAAAALLSGALSACGERAQTASHRKADGLPSSGPASPFTAGTWKAGDAVAWDAQMRTRAQGQNEYSRSGSAP
jgi:hypothetical protein